MVKRLLRSVLGNACLLYEEMISILCDCESAINSRPLTYLSEDPNDLVPLTPSMFMQDITTVGVPDLDQLDKTDVRRRVKYIQSLRQQLRNRFRREYLGILVQPRKKSGYYEVKSGDIVLIENENKKRLFWPLAKVLEVYPSKDKSIRVVRLKTSSGEILRPVRRIYPLEIRSDEQVQAIEDAEISSDDVSVQAQAPNRTVTTRSGRLVKVPLRFLDT